MAGVHAPGAEGCPRKGDGGKNPQSQKEGAVPGFPGGVSLKNDRGRGRPSVPWEALRGGCMDAGYVRHSLPRVSPEDARAAWEDEGLDWVRTGF